MKIRTCLQHQRGVVEETPETRKSRTRKPRRRSRLSLREEGGRRNHLNPLRRQWQKPAHEQERNLEDGRVLQLLLLGLLRLQGLQGQQGLPGLLRLQGLLGLQGQLLLLR